MECRHEPHRKDVYMLRERVDHPHSHYVIYPYLRHIAEPPQEPQKIANLSIITGLGWGVLLIPFFSYKAPRFVGGGGGGDLRMFFALLNIIVLKRLMIR